MFLTDAELQQLTGAKRPSAQIRWLRSRRVRHYVNLVGKPVVAREWLLGESNIAQAPEKPDFSALKGAA